MPIVNPKILNEKTDEMLNFVQASKITDVPSATIRYWYIKDRTDTIAKISYRKDNCREFTNYIPRVKKAETVAIDRSKVCIKNSEPCINLRDRVDAVAYSNNLPIPCTCATKSGCKNYEAIV